VGCDHLLVLDPGLVEGLLDTSAWVDTRTTVVAVAYVEDWHGAHGAQATRPVERFVSNETVHGVLHLGRVLEPSGRHRDQLAILVNPNGVLGEVYLAAIRPFRRLIVYPAMMRRIELASRSSSGADAVADARRGV